MSPFAEPNTPSAVPPDLSAEDDDTLTAQYALGRPCNAGQGARTCWLTGDEDIDLTASFALGEDAGRPFFGETITGALLIRGAQVPFTLDTASAAAVHQFDVPNGAASFEHRIVIADDTIPEGASNASLVWLTPEGNLFNSWDFTLLKNGTAFPPKQTTATETRESTGAERVVDLDSGQPLDQAYHVDASRPLRLSIPVRSRWQRCTDIIRPFAIAALVDGRLQAPAVQLEIPGQTTAFLELTLTNLPNDGALHTLSIAQLPDTTYWEAPLGTLSPIPDATEILGRGSW